jgi:hypothetical protein
MEEHREIIQQPLEKVPDKIVPHAETNFGDETFDSAPIKRGHFGGFNEWIFSLMRPKKKILKQHQPSIRKDLPPKTVGVSPVLNTGANSIVNSMSLIPDGFTVENGLLLQKKTLADRVRDQLRFPIIKSSASMVNGISLAVFAVGAYLLYSALPTRFDLVIGIILVSLAGNVIMNNR